MVFSIQKEIFVKCTYRMIGFYNSPLMSLNCKRIPQNLMQVQLILGSELDKL